MKKNPLFILFLIILVAVTAAFFVYPKNFGANFMPWRLGLDLIGGSHLVYNVDLSKVSAGDQDSVLNGLRDVIERRVNLFGVSEPQVFVAKSGNDSNLVVELAGIKDTAQAIQQIGATPLLDFREVEQNGTSTEFIQTNLTGRYITSAQLAFDPNTQAPQVSISFNTDGANIFEQMTAKNVGKPLAIFLDGSLIEMPTVQEKISGGQAVITGRFTVNEAKTLVERFNAGALPAPITLISQQTISATLGSDSLKKAIIAGIIGTLIVMAFMLAYYRMLGIFAAVALLLYVFLTLGIFKIIPITLSLAGLAGFILTIGMAVDANILIFERIKEELKKGFSRTTAIEEGFRRAWPSIRDSNTSTIITAIILYFFTSSFVQGFALTLLIGVLISLFSAITTTRLLLRIFIKNPKQEILNSKQISNNKSQTV
ncbi:MAG: protein translocase subunit SecD [Candidatus Liptonbacteria bacterium]|nr:protein translocase subunit SecD [Candidatus Liptonbacteria bacterium]